AVLQKEGIYHVKLIREVEGLLPVEKERNHQLVIPVLPLRNERAEKILATLCSVQAYFPLLPVVRPDSLNSFFDNLLVDNHDFLVTPLREEEVRFRVRRLAI